LALDEATEDVLTSLLKGRTTRITRLFPDEAARKDAIRRARAVHRKAKENYEERGISTLFVACGIATWDNVRTWEPAAPVLLIPAQLEPMGAAFDDFEISVAGDPEINPTLLHILKVDYDCEIKLEALLDHIDGPIDEPWEIQATNDWLAKESARVPGFTTSPRFVLANFTYAKLPMVRDLEGSEEQLVAHDLIAALAGDAEARDAVRGEAPSPDTMPTAEPPSADEFLVLDADSTQSYAINAVLGGKNLIVRGPPGTGKSQSIANLIGSLVARGKRVLFVAEKRAAIDAVLKRLKSNGLDELVLDLHGRVVSRKAFAQDIARALYSSRSAPRVDRAREHRRLDRRRTELNRYAAALHDKRMPWNLSVYEIQAELVRLGRETRYITRFHGAALDKLHGELAEQAAADLDEYVSLGGFTLGSSASPWARSSVTSGDAAQEAFHLLDAARMDYLPRAVKALADAADDTGLPEPANIAEGTELTELWARAAVTETIFRASVHDLDLESLLAAMTPATRGLPRRLMASLFSGPYRAARSELRQHTNAVRQSDADLHRNAAEALALRSAWHERSPNRPTVPGDLSAVRESSDRLVQGLQVLERFVGRALQGAAFDDLADLLSRLADDRGTLAKLPELHRLRTALQAAGLTELMAEIEAQPDPDSVAKDAFEWVWLQSILDRVLLTDPAIGSITGAALDAAVDEFQADDREHIETTADRIRRIAAERATAARDDHPEQAQLVQRQAALRQRHMPVRTLVHNASDVLLALKPCWAMSPLMVSQLLPTRKYFDVVVFDEASQVTPADAATSILRGDQLVVAGDERQLPPTSFFASEAAGETEEEYADEDALLLALSGTQGFESILDALNSLFPARMLQWHYRSRDERLIAFSNAYVYDKLLTTFPGVGGEQCMEHVEVSWEPGSDTNSPSAEVRRVVELILDHAATRPDESLGVIAMGIKHANRIDETLRERLRDHPELEAYFSEDIEEPFFVKNLERVQGDERDAIILTVGYGKNDRGQMLYRFGPLLMAGGERRLNVAVTRAKRRLALVTSFSSGDLDPERLNSDGMKLLRSYVQYAESGGDNLGERAATIPQLNPFEVDVRDTLTARGMRLMAQHGASGYRIDFAVQDPDQPGRFILAIECDGASFHSAQTARDRDRLRQEQLERIGWRFHRIWSSEWFHNKEAAVDKVLVAYERAIGGDEDGGVSSHEPTGRNMGSERETDAAEPVAHGRGRRPNVPQGWKVDEYWDHQLIQMIDWIESDELLRTEDEVIGEVMAELGFQRRGARIVSVLRSAIKRARHNRKPPRPRSLPARRASERSVGRTVDRPAPESSPGPTAPPPLPHPISREPAESAGSSANANAQTTAEHGSGWDDAAGQRPLAELDAERRTLEAQRRRLPAQQYAARLDDILARRKPLIEARRVAMARVVDGVVVTLEDPEGSRVRSKVSGATVMHATRDGWVAPLDTTERGISHYSSLGKAIMGAKIGDVRTVDGVTYTIVDIQVR
jgi:very-short-patch-repair endonuclease/transcription elongation GreA/GreB family factor